MALNFPNVSRSYDANRHCVRFWGHDAAFEIAFQIELGALSRIEPKASQDEGAMLRVFDGNRPRILKVAGEVYARRREAFYTLAAKDF